MCHAQINQVNTTPDLLGNIRNNEHLADTETT